MEKVKVLAFAGSFREASLNKKLIRHAADAAREAGADVTLIDLRDYPLPIYDGDFEDKNGLPDNAKKLKKLMIAHDIFMIASPEYNSGIPGGLKNMIDWTSRPEPEDDDRLICYKDKFAFIMSATPSPLGGLRGLYALRYVLNNIFVHVIPNQVLVREAHKSFDDDGNFIDAKKKDDVYGVAKKIVDMVSKIKVLG